MADKCITTITLVETITDNDPRTPERLAAFKEMVEADMMERIDTSNTALEVTVEYKLEEEN